MFNDKIRTPLGVLCLSVSAVVVTAAIIIGPIAFLDDPTVFELDANVRVNGTGDDWANSAGTASGLARAVATSAPEPGQPTVSGWPFVVPDPGDISIFTTGGSKDTNDVSQWKNTNGSVPDKDNITNAYAAAYKVNTTSGGTQPHTWIFFGADRFANNGDSNIGFWFFQNAIGPGSGTGGGGTPFTGTPCPTGATNCNPGDLHRDGDILIVSAFTQGGAIGTIQIYHWDKTVGLVLDDDQNAGQCTPSSPSHTDVCAIVNTSSTSAAWPYTPKAGPAGSFPQGSFFEGGFDLTAIFAARGLPEPCFSTFLAETRSSQSTTAQLKDFVLGSFQLCSVAVTKACSGTPTIVEINNVAYVHYTFTGNVINDGAGSLYKLTVADQFPTGSINTVLTQPVTPAQGLTSGASAAYSGSFDFPGNGKVTNNATANAASCPTCGNTVTNDHNGNPAAAAADFGVAGCNVVTQPGLSLTKSCVVNLVPQTGGGIVLEDATTMTVCNTSADDKPISNINLTNNVQMNPPAAGTDFSIVTGLTLGADECRTFNANYRPNSCVSTNGRCLFQDTVRISSIPKDVFGANLPPSAIPLPATAECRACPDGSCSLSRP
ncbi:MAG: hypothetical protein HYX27_22050 [Acidobacteria bacterium]|nr:hypothetical protein [Acidobacteriota bacterium]